MIRKIESKDYDFVKELIRKDIFQNVYLYIDINSYGYESDKITTYLLEKEGAVKAVVYMYYNSLQLFQAADLDDDEIQQMADFIDSLEVEMMTGKVSLAQALLPKFGGRYTISEGVIMTTGKGHDYTFSDECEIAKSVDCKDIARLICSDDDIGGHYTIDLLEEQLRDRMENLGCKNIIVRMDEKIVSHAATYADIPELAVIGGVVTDVDYRHRGLAGKAICSLSSELIREGKSPVLYCYHEHTVKWYKTMGWEIATECAKLELKK